MPLLATVLGMLLRVLPNLNRFLVFTASFTIFKIFAALGIAIVSYPSIKEIVVSAQTEMAQLLGILPADVFGILSIMQVPQGIGIIFSAVLSVAGFKAVKLAFLQK